MANEQEVRGRPNAPSAEAIKVTVSDPTTGEVLDEAVVDNDYVLICAGSAHLTHTQVNGGTHVLTVKGSRRG